jgi:hypothetical protein
MTQRAEGRLLEVVGESMQLPIPGRPLPTLCAVICEDESGKIQMRVLKAEEYAEIKKATDAAAGKMIKAEYDKRLADVKAAGAQAKAGATGGGTKLVGDILDTPNLAVGRLFEITADYGQGSVTIQVMVALKTMISTSSNLVDIYATGGELRTAKERWHGWRSGQLRFLEDIIFCQDIIENHKRTAIKDNTGTYLQNRERDTKNRGAAPLSGKASIGTASAITVLATATARKLEAAIGGKLSDFATREKVFKRTYCMIMLVVDTEWDQVVVYHRGIPKPTALPVDEYVRAKGKGGSDVADIVKLFLSGTAPTL